MSKIFLYAEVQVSVPFAQAPWRQFNPQMKKQTGLIRKTWLSGLETETNYSSKADLPGVSTGENRPMHSLIT